MTESTSRAASYLFVMCAVIALCWSLAARIFGPSDVWDQTQPKTVSYTTDIIVNGRWVLPIERGEYPATKPPFYNWIAVPFVAMAGFDSDLAHKSPSVLALVASAVIVFVLARRILPDQSAIGASIATIAFIANYPMFKLGYLARPDMVLTLWLLTGWASATAIACRNAAAESDQSHATQALKFSFWASVALASLTKGPAAFPLLLYAILISRTINGSWRAAGQYGWRWGVLLAIAPIALWIYGVWTIDAHHLKQELLFDEIAGRVTGTGEEGSSQGPWGLIKGLPVMTFYAVARFMPWSVPAMLMMVHLWLRGDLDRKHTVVVPPFVHWLHSAGLYILIVIAFYTLSSGKRADYIASVYAPGSLLCAYWLLHVAPKWLRRAPLVAPASAAISLSAITWVNMKQTADSSPPIGDQMKHFISMISMHIHENPYPVAFWSAGNSHVQAYLGYSEIDGNDAVRRLCNDGTPFWVVAGISTSDGPDTLPAWMADSACDARVEQRAKSFEVSRKTGWPKQLSLYLVEPN